MMGARRSLIYLLFCILQHRTAATPRGYRGDLATNDIPAYDGGYPPEYASSAPTISSFAPSSSLMPSVSSNQSATASSSYPSSSSSVAGPDQAGCSYWYESMPRNGISAFNGDTSYKVFRSVKDFGAKGDGVTDDTSAINAAITNGNRCGPSSCGSSSITPALVYFPPGTYLVSSPIVDYYFTQLVGNPNCLPVIKAGANFNGPWVIDGDQYQSNGQQGFINTNVFWRQIRNFVLDLTSVPATTNIRAVHWPTGQATSIQNVIFKLSAASGTQHEGLFVENGSGGFMTDLTFYGGMNAADLGNQQFTVRNFTFSNAVTAIKHSWDWGWTYQGISIDNCGTGIDVSAEVNNFHAVGSITFIDSTITNTPVGILTAQDASAPSGSVPFPGIILENVHLSNVGTAVQGSYDSILAGSSGQMTISGWGQGNSYTPNGPTKFQGPIKPVERPASLLSGSGAYYARSKPLYEGLASSQFVSARSAGAKGDGRTDDTATLQAAITSSASSGKVLFVDSGTYIVTSTIHIPNGAKIVGESYPIIMSKGSYFADMNSPQPVIQVGKAGESGNVEWSNMLISVQGAQAGAILIEWNLASPGSAPSGMWDVHARIGGTIGSQLQFAQCPTTPAVSVTADTVNQNCIVAFATMHITRGASGVYMENVWLWVADHDVDDPALQQISLYAGRGLLVDSTAGPIWMYGTAVEHHTLYQYQFSSGAAVFAGHIQTESPYYQPNPPAPAPFPAASGWGDPTSFGAGPQSAWGMRVVGAPNVRVYGAGLYSFFVNNNVTCAQIGNGEACQPRVLSVENTTGFGLYSLNTVGVTNLLTVNAEDKGAYSNTTDGFVDSIALFAA